MSTGEKREPRSCAGTLVLLSYDRHFLGKLAERVFKDDHAEMRTYEGTSEYYPHKVHGEEMPHP